MKYDLRGSKAGTNGRDLLERGMQTGKKKCELKRKEFLVGSKQARKCVSQREMGSGMRLSTKYYSKESQFKKPEFRSKCGVSGSWNR